MFTILQTFGWIRSSGEKSNQLEILISTFNKNEDAREHEKRRIRELKEDLGKLQLQIGVVEGQLLQAERSLHERNDKGTEIRTLLAGVRQDIARIVL